MPTHRTGIITKIESTVEMEPREGLTMDEAEARLTDLGHTIIERDDERRVFLVFEETKEF